MEQLLQHPAVQAGVIPLLAALLVAAALSRRHYAWLAIPAGYAAMIAVSTGFAFEPLTASRKLVLVVLLSSLAGIVVDLLPHYRGIASSLSIAAGLVATWVFASVISQREGTLAWLAGAGIAAFVALLVFAAVRHRDNGLRTGAAGLGLGLATGVVGVLSASIGFLMGGVAVAASAGAVLLVQVVFSRSITPGFTGTLPIGLATALFAVGTVMLAELKWYLLPLLLLIPVAVLLPAAYRAPRIVRAAILAGYALVAAAIPILAAWYAARGSVS